MFIRYRKLNILLAFIIQSYFSLPKDVRLSSTHQGCSETLSNQAFEGVKRQVSTIVNPSDIFGISFLTSYFLFLRMSYHKFLCRWAIKHMHPSFGQRNINNGKQGFMREWTWLPYAQIRWFTCSLLRVTWLVLFEGCEWVKPCKFAVVVSIDQKTKTKKKERKT